MGVVWVALAIMVHNTAGHFHRGVSVVVHYSVLEVAACMHTGLLAGLVLQGTCIVVLRCHCCTLLLALHASIQCIKLQLINRDIASAATVCQTHTIIDS